MQSHAELHERQAVPVSEPLAPVWGGGFSPRQTSPSIRNGHDHKHPSGGAVATRTPWLAAGISRALDQLADRVVLFRFGNLVFVTFGLFAALGAAVTLAGAGTILIGQGLGGGMFLALAVGASAAVVGGSWLAGLALDYRLVRCQGWVALRRPIFVSWGGLLAMPLTLGVFSALSGFSALLLLDALARTVPLGHALGRLGCLCYGCCFGRPTHGCLAITYRNREAKAVRVAGLWGVPLHPAALYEAVLEFGIFLIVNLAAVMNVPVGVPAGLALLLYGAGRFAIEFLRDNDGRLVVAWVSLNHIISLAVAALGGLALCMLLVSPHRAPPISWGAGLDAIPWLLVAIVPGALVMFFGFAMHWRRVGHW